MGFWDKGRTGKGRNDVEEPLRCGCLLLFYVWLVSYLIW